MTKGQATVEARELRVAGRVQGVGFRPFVRRLARRQGVVGWVRNEAGEVTLHAEADAQTLAGFALALIREAPPLARPWLRTSRPAAVMGVPGFEIEASVQGALDRAVLPPDQFACDDCLAELADPTARRFRHPFINCTQCGPRYTLITGLPYDRPSTAMADFALCADCAREYADPDDRRYHAQPLACPACGPRLTFHDGQGARVGNEAALTAALGALASGAIVAVKGIGGYHLACLAEDEGVVARLRRRKRRPSKPLAVMAPWSGADGLATARRLAELDDVGAAALLDPVRPIVLCRERPDSGLAAAIAPGLNEVGLILPYSPLHHLLLADLGRPLVMTSGNLSGEPVLTDPVEARARLAAIADAVLDHDRPIVRPADDPVLRPIAGRARPLRLGRGLAPLELPWPTPLPRPLLAVGGQQKATVALAWGDRVVVSPHIGDLDTPRGLAVFGQVIADLERLYGVRAETVAHDAHPGYAGTRWAKAGDRATVAVPHHAAHASALVAEHGLGEPALVFTWDGVGLGPDGRLWGGETLFGRPGAWRRLASFVPFAPPGGERAGREPWRSALALCWQAGLTPPALRPPEETALLRAAWAAGLNAPETSAVGRLFDAAAAFLGLGERYSYEGEGPSRLEAISQPITEEVAPLPWTREEDDLRRLDWRPLLPPLLDAGRTVAARAGLLHRVLAETIAAVAEDIARENGACVVGLSGGVFQNRLLSEQARQGLAARGFRVLLPERVPANDGGLSYGQAVEAAALLAAGEGR